MKKLSYLLIVAGILIASYPKLSDMYSNYWQQRLLKELEIDDQQEEIIRENYTELNRVFEEEREVLAAMTEGTSEEIEEIEEIEEDSEENQQEVKEIPKPSIQTRGRIEIPRINLRLPILQGTSNTALNRGAGHLTGTNLPGEIGNAAIAAHRGHSYGRLFNRLDELEVGDIIIIYFNNHNYQYTVYETKLVKPTEISVLNRNSRDRVLTLITCDPIFDPTHRLIVHAIME
ncbi:class D sortase [Natronincola peptidivorans]|nr:class D sortase [Natronincola peptidivorans]